MSKADYDANEALKLRGRIAAAMREALAETMTEIQIGHRQIDLWNFGIPIRDEIDDHELSLSERIADLCLRLNRAERMLELLELANA